MRCHECGEGIVGRSNWTYQDGEVYHAGCWLRRESNAMGLRGGQGHDAPEIYETGVASIVCLVGVVLLLLAALAAAIWL